MQELQISFKTLKERAKEMRLNPTEEEKLLWNKFLRNYVPRFHRQYVIEPYIVDFYCPKLGVVVEVDGGQHNFSNITEYDKKRDFIIEKHGYKIIRVTNRDVKLNLNNTKIYIDTLCRERAVELNLNVSFGVKK